MNLSHTQIGDATEYRFFLYCIEHGIDVSKPLTNNLPYDCIIDYQNKLIRVQVKTSHYKDEDKSAIIFSCRSSHTNSHETKNIKYTNKEIDFFCTYFENQCYLIPVNECSVEKTLRFSPPKNGQIKGVTFADDYTLEKQLNRIQK